jgi:hypothetical protein
MQRLAMQIYLTPEQHMALADEARRSGRSMTQVVRDLIESHLCNGLPPTDLSDLVGVADVGHPTNIAEDKDRMLDEAFSDILGH